MDDREIEASEIDRSGLLLVRRLCMVETNLDNTTDSFDQYLALIEDSCSVLTAEQERQLIYRVALGDREARDQMIMHNQRLVISIAKVYLPRCPGDLVDLVSEGNLGLMHALEKFDFDRRDIHGNHLKFSTYATYWIRQSIKRYIQRAYPAVHIPVHVHDDMYSVRRTRTRLSMQLEREATCEEIAAAAELSVRKVEELLALDQVNALSLNRPITDESEMTILDSIPDETAADAYDEVDANDHISTWLAILSPQEREVIASMFGLCGHEVESSPEIARRRGCSNQNVNLLYHRAMKRLRTRMMVKTVS